VGPSELDREMTYLRGHFLSLEQLSEAAGVTAQRILSLVAHGCIPRHSYELKRVTLVSSFVLGDVPIREDDVQRFYAPALSHWIKIAEEMATDSSLERVAAQIKATFCAGYKRALLGLDAHDADLMGCATTEGRVDDEKFENMFEELWTHWLQGTYGLCVWSPLSPEDVLRKELAVARLTRLTLDGKKPVFSQDERAEVLRAIGEYDAVAMPFAPHDYSSSSRKRLVDDVMPRLLVESLVALRANP
jgi:hypothetical protein